MKDSDFQFLIECQTEELAAMLAEDFGYDMLEALDKVYKSQTFQLLENPSTDLYFQSAVYTYQYLKKEMEQF